MHKILWASLHSCSSFLFLAFSSPIILSIAHWVPSWYPFFSYFRVKPTSVWWSSSEQEYRMYSSALIHISPYLPQSIFLILFHHIGWFSHLEQCSDVPAVDSAFRLGQETDQILFEFQQTHWASRSKSCLQSQGVSSLALYCGTIPNRTFKKFEKCGFPTARSKSIWWVSWLRWNTMSYQLRNLNSSQVLDNFLLHN